MGLLRSALGPEIGAKKSPRALQQALAFGLPNARNLDDYPALRGSSSVTATLPVYADSADDFRV